MTKEEYLELAAKHYDELKALQGEKSFYEYEKRFDQIMTGLGRDLLEGSIGEVPNDVRKKTSSGPVSVK